VTIDVTIVVHEICTCMGLSYANEDCTVWANTKVIVACAHMIFTLDCAVEVGKTVEEI